MSRLCLGLKLRFQEHILIKYNYSSFSGFTWIRVWIWDVRYVKSSIIKMLVVQYNMKQRVKYVSV